MESTTKNAFEVVVLVLGALLAVAAIGGVAFVGSAVLIASVAKAEGADYRDNRWANQRFCAHYNWLNECTRYRYERRRVHRYNDTTTYRDSIRYYAAPRYDEERDDRGRCHEVRKAVGDQHLTVDGAKKAANDAWAGTVRFHLGESAMDLTNAREIVYVCSRSSIKEAGSSITTLGQSLTRCEVSAQPCRPPKLPLEREDR